MNRRTIKEIEFIDEIRKRIAGLDAGEGTEINSDEELAQYFRDIESEVHRENNELPDRP
jgi:hypothetical protein